MSQRIDQLFNRCNVGCSSCQHSQSCTRSKLNAGKKFLFLCHLGSGYFFCCLAWFLNFDCCPIAFCFKINHASFIDTILRHQKVGNLIMLPLQIFIFPDPKTTSLIFFTEKAIPECITLTWNKIIIPRWLMNDAREMYLLRVWIKICFK